MKDNFVKLWYGELLSENGKDQDYWLLLNKEERKKASAFVRTDQQKKYIKTRGVLRTILASYVNTEPQKIIIKTGEFGKPFVSEEWLHFNLSHTGNKFVIAVSNCSEIGVDIEQNKDRKSLSALVDKCFSATEANYWNALPEQQKIQMFFYFWVRKEAFVKAVGRGIGLGLNLCQLNPEGQDCFLSIPREYGFASDWKISEAKTGSDDVCAIVTKDLEFEYRKKKWE